jgi:hypothetical protein
MAQILSCSAVSGIDSSFCLSGSNPVTCEIIQYVFLFMRIMLASLFFTQKRRVSILDSIVVSIPACHAGDPSSILGRGAFCLLFVSPFVTTKILSRRYLAPVA